MHIYWRKVRLEPSYNRQITGQLPVGSLHVVLTLVLPSPSSVILVPV